MDFEINLTTSSIPVIHIAQKLLIQCDNDPTVFILLIIIFGYTYLNFMSNSAHDINIVKNATYCIITIYIKHTLRATVMSRI